MYFHSFPWALWNGYYFVILEKWKTQAAVFSNHKTYMFKVSIRHRHTPSRDRKFLCLKPEANCSQICYLKEK